MIKNFLRRQKYHLFVMIICLATATGAGLYLAVGEPAATRQSASVVGGEAGDFLATGGWNQNNKAGADTFAEQQDNDASRLATPHFPPLRKGGRTPPSASFLNQVQDKLLKGGGGAQQLAGVATTPSLSPPCLPAGDLPKGEKGEEATVTDNIHASLFVGDRQYAADVAPGSSVYDLMKILSDRGEFSFKAKEYVGLGQFVEEINGLANESRKGTYWIYYINGQSADRGISNYIIKSGDIINWKYEKANL